VSYDGKVPEVKVAIIVPCYNEERRLPVEAFRAELRGEGPQFFFVNDGSRDGTAGVLEKLRAEYPTRVTVVDEGINQGKAEAVRTGICRAMAQGYEFVGFWDADLATPLEAIGQFLRVFEERPHLNMVFGARIKLLGREVHRKLARHYLGRVFATFVSVMLQLPIYDTQCGAKIFRTAAQGERLFGARFLSRWVFDVEILARYLGAVGVAEAERTIYEYPLEKWEDVGGSKLKSTDFLVAFRDVLKIKWKYLR